MDGAAARRIGVGDGGRVGSTPGPVIAGDRPEVSLLGASPAGIEHRRHRLIDGDLERAQNEFTQPKIKRLQLRGGKPTQNASVARSIATPWLSRI